MKRTPQDKDEVPAQGRWDPHRSDQGEPKKAEERPRILAKHEKKKESEEAEGIEVKETKESGGSKRTSLSEAEENSHHVTFAGGTGEENSAPPLTGDGPGQVAESQQRSLPRKIMMRYNTEPSADDNQSKQDQVVVQKTPAKDKPKQVQIQDSQLKEEEIKTTVDVTPDSPGKAAIGWNVHGRGPIKSKTLYEPEGKESEEKFKKYFHTAEGSNKNFHKAEKDGKDAKPVPSEPRQHTKEGEAKDVQSIAGTPAPAPAAAVTEGKAPPPLNTQETGAVDHKDTPVEIPAPVQVPSEGPGSHKFPQKTGGRQRNGEDRQSGDSYDVPRRRDGDYPSRGRRGSGRGKDWQDRPAKGRERDRQEHLARDDQDKHNEQNKPDIPAREQDKHDHPVRDQDKHDHPARDQEHLVRDQERRGHQDRRDHSARNQDKRDYPTRDQDRRDYLPRDQERHDHPVRDKSRQDHPAKGKDRQEAKEEYSAREHDRQDHPKYQDRRDQQEEQDRQSKRKGQDQPTRAYSSRGREQDLHDHSVKDKEKNDNLPSREPEMQEHYPRQNAREKDVQHARQEYYSGPRQRGDKRVPRGQEGRDQDERKKVQGQKPEKVERLTPEIQTRVEQKQVADTAAPSESEKISTKQQPDAVPSSVQVLEQKPVTVEDGSQRRGFDHQRRSEPRQWNKDSRRQGQVRSGGPRQRGDGQGSGYGDRRQKGNWEKDLSQTSFQSTTEAVGTSQQSQPVVPQAKDNKDAHLEPRTPTESSAAPLKSASEAASQLPPPQQVPLPQGPPATKQERARWDQRSHRDDWGGGRHASQQTQRGTRYDQKERQSPRDDSAGGQSFQRGKESAAVSGDKQPVGEPAQENKSQTVGSAVEPEQKLVGEQKPLRESRESYSRRYPKGGRGGGARGKRYAGHERFQQPREEVVTSSELEANGKPKDSPSIDLGYSQLEDINSDSDYSDFEEEPASSSEVKAQQDQTKLPPGSQAYRSDQEQYRQPRSFRGHRRQAGGRGTYHGTGRGRGRTRNEGERRDRRGSAEVVGGAGAKEHTQVAVENTVTDADTSAKSGSNKEVKVTDKKETSTGPKSDLSHYDLHSHKIAIVDDNMKEVEDDRDSGNSGAFVEVTSKRTQKEKQKKEREEQQKKEEVGKHRDEDKHRRGHRSRPADSGMQVQPSRTAWASTNKTELEESSTLVAWGSNDASNVPTTGSSSSSSWITNALPSNAAPGAELKMANQRIDAAAPPNTIAATRTNQSTTSASYTSKDSSNSSHSGAGGGGGYTPFSSPFALSLLSAAVDQSMSSGHEVLPTPSSEKPLATAKVFTAGTQEEPKGSVSLGRGAVGHGKEGGGHGKDAAHVPPRFQSGGRGAGRGHSGHNVRKENAKVRKEKSGLYWLCLVYLFTSAPLTGEATLCATCWKESQIRCF